MTFRSFTQSVEAGCPLCTSFGAKFDCAERDTAPQDVTSPESSLESGSKFTALHIEPIHDPSRGEFRVYMSGPNDGSSLLNTTVSWTLIALSS